MGLRIGLLVGIAFAVFKTVQSRRDTKSGPTPEPWQPIVDTPRPRPADEPVERPIDEVGEPIQEPPRPETPRVVGPADLKMPDVRARAREPESEPEPEKVEAEVAMAAEQIVDPDPVAKPEPLDVVPIDDQPVAPVQKSAKKAVKKAVKKAAAAKKAVAKKVAKKAVTARPVPTADDAVASNEPYVIPVGGICPQTHQVKAKLSSKLFHLPGMLAYARTTPDRCYADAEAAEADGFTRARR